jgi:orotate phosphoribosyltransferase
MIYSNPVAEKVASLLLQIDAIKLSPQKPFTWASGWKSPIYCDNRLTLSYPNIRTFLKNNFISLIKERLNNMEGIAGVATAGIAHGALIADGLESPFLYVRSSPKAHGLTNQVEGKLIPGQKIVVVEDLVSTGKSSLQVVQTLRDAGADVIGMIAIFTYNFDVAEEAFKQADCKLYTLSDYNSLIPVAVAEKIVSAENLETLKQWRQSPDKWMQ